MERDNLVTLFGGSGFVGRHLVRRFADAGTRVRVVCRNPDQAVHLQSLGNAGQIAVLRGSLNDDDAIARAMAGSDVVVNLVGILYESRFYEGLYGAGEQTFRAVHVDVAGLLAGTAAKTGAPRFIQVSAIGAAADSPARYGRSKAAGEATVKEAFPDATILRPSIVFGPEDGFFNRFAALSRFMPGLPLIGGGATRFQPVYVGDVAETALRCAGDPATKGRTFELGGPRTYSFRDLLKLMLAEIGRRRLLLPVPFWAASLEALFLELLPVPPLTRDQVAMLKRDNVVAAGASGLADLGITPTAVETIVPSYLARYRSSGK
ncbi:MAG: complex I NDUFA9 subunit family protein [Alphaproteobacteria bacterium]